MEREEKMRTFNEQIRKTREQEIEKRRIEEE